MQTKKLSEYRSHLAKYHQQIVDTRDRLRVSDRNGSVVVLSAEDYDNMLETLYILQDETTVKSLLQTRLSISQGTFQGSEIKDAFKDLMDS